MIELNKNFDNAPWHPGIDYAGKNLQWIQTDSQENFNNAIKDPKNQHYFQQQGWLDPEFINYSINSKGFRCEEFELQEPCMIALGCSFTMGVGLPLQSIWCNLLGKQLGLKVYNLAWGGISADTCFRLARYWIPTLKPKIVCMLTPPETRFELLLEEGSSPPVEVFMPYSMSKFYNQHDIFFKHWWLNNQNCLINSEKNVLAIAKICIENNCDFIQRKVSEDMPIDQTKPARDLQHAGPDYHKNVADKILEEISWP